MDVPEQGPAPSHCCCLCSSPAALGAGSHRARCTLGCPGAVSPLSIPIPIPTPFPITGKEPPPLLFRLAEPSQRAALAPPPAPAAPRLPPAAQGGGTSSPSCLGPASAPGEDPLPGHHIHHTWAFSAGYRAWTVRKVHGLCSHVRFGRGAELELGSVRAKSALPGLWLWFCG